MEYIDKNEENDWVDYPYLEIGKKPYVHKHPTDEQIEKIISG